MGAVAPLLLLLAASIAVKQDGVPLRTGCASADAVVTTVAQGTPVEIRFAMNGDRETCYKVALTSEGKAVTGYLPASSLTGLDDFRKDIQNAPVVAPTARQDQEPVARSSASGPFRPLANGTDPVAQASALLDQNQPRAALEVLETSMKTRGRDYQVLVAAGIAAYRSDQPRVALDYLDDAERIHQDPSVQQLIAKLRKESAGDLSGERLYGTRFLLRYEGGNLSSEIARSMVALLEQEYSRISGELGCRADERIVTVVQSKEAYRASTDAAEWSGGLFDGSKIRVPVIESASISPRTRQVLAHELVHACLASLGRWPTWFHEGLAQKLSGATLSASRKLQIRSVVRAGKIPRLENMNQSWSRLDREHAEMAYDYALAAADLVYEAYRNYGIQNILRNPERFPQITADLDRRLGE